MTLTFKPIAIPAGQFSDIDLGEPDSFGISILICAAKESEARKLDDALTELLLEYDYDVLSGRREFRGTFFISYKSSKKTPELQKDFEVFWGSDPRAQPGAQLPQENPEKWKKLKDALETVKAFFVVGTLLVGSVAAIYEFHEEVNKHIGHQPTVSSPAPHQHRIVKVPLQKSLTQIDAEKNPRQFERMLNTQVENNLKSRGIFKQKQSGADTEHLRQ